MMFNKFSTFVILSGLLASQGLFFYHHLAEAHTIELQRPLKTETIETELRRPLNIKTEPSHVKNQLLMRLEQSYFYNFKSLSTDLAKAQAPSLWTLGFRGENRAETFRGDGEYTYSAAEKDHYINLRELYYTTPVKNLKLSLGRKKHDWSQAEKLWNMGIWQPRYIWSRLRPEVNGLTGLFLEGQVHSSPVRWTLFVSPVHIPELTPLYRFSNSHFQSQNPWFSEPAPFATVPGLFENRKIIYNLNLPSPSEVVWQQSLAMQLEWRRKEHFCQMNFAYKPMNQILLSADPVIRIDLPDSPPGVEVSPFLDYHRLLSAECGRQSAQGWYGFVSVANENPLSRARPSAMVTKRLQDTHTLASTLGYQASRHRTHFSLMNLWGGDAFDSGDKASLNSSFFVQRYEYYRALQVGHQQQWRWGGREWDGHLNLIWDLQQRGWQWVSGLAVVIQRQAKAFIQAEGLAKALSSQPPIENSFFNVYKMNDQVSAGVQVVF